MTLSYVVHEIFGFEAIILDYALILEIVQSQISKSLNLIEFLSIFFKFRSPFPIKLEKRAINFAFLYLASALAASLTFNISLTDEAIGLIFFLIDWDPQKILFFGTNVKVTNH